MVIANATHELNTVQIQNTHQLIQQGLSASFSNQLVVPSTRSYFDSPEETQCQLVAQEILLNSCTEVEDVETCVMNLVEQVCPSFKKLYADVVASRLGTFFTQSNTSAFIHHIHPDCLTPNCSDIDSNSVHSRAKSAAEIIATKHQNRKWYDFNHLPPEWKDMQEFLRFRFDDPREKLLYLTSEDDHNGALNPRLVSGILSTLAFRYDMKYGVVQKYSQICRQIAATLKAGPLSHVVLSGHGNRISIYLSQNSTTGKIHRVEDQNFKKCFEALKASGKITLLSCSTGKPGPQGFVLDNLAQKIADATKRTVIAPQDDAYPILTSLLNENSDVLYHPKVPWFALNPWYNTNLFRPFRPFFQNCTSIPPLHQIHEKEVTASGVVKEGLQKKSLYADDLIRNPTEFLTHCEDDPREKYLLLNAQHIPYHYIFNEGTHPNHFKETFSTLADEFDFKYKTVSSAHDICEAVRQAKKTGELAGVIIMGTKNPNKPGMKLSETSTINNNFLGTLKCLKEIKPEGNIVFLGASLGQDQTNGSPSIAQAVANKVQRTVLAAVCPIYGSELSLTSVDPVNFTHAEHSYWTKYRTGCWNASSSNLMKTFIPQK